MANGERDKQSVRFANFELDLQSGELWRGSDRTLLPDQPFRILSTLVQVPGTLVTRDELRRELWSDDTFVDFEHGLNAAIKRLREVLGDSASQPRFIETLPRRGYRFIAPVHRSGSPPAEFARPAVPPASRRWLAPAMAVTAAMAVAALVSLRTLQPTAASDAFHDARLVRLTSLPGLNIDPALSPDGSRVAYASDRSGAGNLDIWVESIDREETLQLTSDAVDETEPSFSPDGRLVVFATRETGGVYVVGARGGAPQLVVDSARARTPRFSPDGRWIAYWTGLPVNVSRAAGASGSLFVVSANGGTPRQLAADFASARHPVWSPDGRALVFLGARGEAAEELDWYIIPREGGAAIKTGALEALRVAGAVTARDVLIPSAWRSPGNEVLASSTATVNANVWQLAIASDTGQLVGTPRRLTFGTAVERSPAAGAASRRIAFASLVENVDIWRLPLDPATGTVGGTLQRVTDNPGADVLLNASRTGETLAFVSSRTGRDEIWVKDLAGGLEHQVTRDGSGAAHMSPDGTRVAIWHGGPGRQEVMLVEVRGGSRAPLCVDCERAFGWTRDGSRVLIARANPSRLFVRDLASEREVLLVSHPTWNLRQARFSPDGNWVAFYATESPEKRVIYVVPSAAAAVPVESWTPVVPDVGSQQSWSDDGSLLYYISQRDGATCIWMQQLDPATKRPVGSGKPVLHFHDPRLRAGTTAIATIDVQAGFLYVTLTETVANIWMVEER